MSLLTALERGSLPLDHARSAGFRWLRRSPLLAVLSRRREARLSSVAVLHALVAGSLALTFPVHLYMLGPLLFGVAHVAADVRYLVLRQELSRWWRRVIAFACAGLVALRVAEEAHWSRAPARLEFAFATLFALCAVAAALAARGRPRRALIAASGVLALGLAAASVPQLARLLLLHAHNLLAIGLLFLLFPARTARLAAPLVLIAALAIALASGAGYRVTLASSGASGFHRHVFEIADWVAPGLRADYALGVTCAYVFLQSVHYLVWLFLIPQRAQRGEGTLTFAMSARSLVKDFGSFGLATLLLLGLGVLVAAAFDAPRAQRTYLSLGMFHAYLELSMLVYLWVRAPRSEAGNRQ